MKATVNKREETACLETIWTEICDVVKSHVSLDTYERWFSGTSLVEASEETLTVEVPNYMYQLWIESNYLDTLGGAVERVLRSARKIAFKLSDSDVLARPEKCGETREAKKNGKVGGKAKLEGVEEHAPAKNVAHERGAARGVSGFLNGGLSPRYTFESFVTGPNNKFAHAAAEAVGDSPAMTYNPLFIYGGVGLGKTHLMHGIGNCIAEKNPRTKVVYVTSEKFTNDFIEALRNNSLVQFRKHYRLADVLLIDDIQFVAGKEASQEEFFHTFNSLSDGHKQIVLSSDRPPSEIEHLERRLVSRFEWGLTAEMQPPEVETRVAILRRKMHDWKVEVAPFVIDFLAERIRNNVRRLEGGLMRVASYCSLHDGNIRQEALEELLRDILQEEARKIVSIDVIQKRVAEHYDVRLADMTSKRRPANIAFPRQIAMYLSRKLTDASLTEIGDAFGGRDHGTVIHACKTVAAKMELRKEVRQSVGFLLDKVRE